MATPAGGSKRKSEFCQRWADSLASSRSDNRVRSRPAPSPARRPASSCRRGNLQQHTVEVALGRPDRRAALPASLPELRCAAFARALAARQALEHHVPRLCLGLLAAPGVLRSHISASLALPISNASGVRQSALSRAGARVAVLSAPAHEEPDRFAVGQEHLGLRRFVVPAHPPRPAEIDRAGFELNALGAVAVAFQESGLQRLKPAVVRFERRAPPATACGSIRVAGLCAGRAGSANGHRQDRREAKRE